MLALYQRQTTGRGSKVSNIADGDRRMEQQLPDSSCNARRRVPTQANALHLAKPSGQTSIRRATACGSCFVVWTPSMIGAESAARLANDLIDDVSYATADHGSKRRSSSRAAG